MKKLPKGGLIGKAVDAYLSIREKQIPLHAAYAGYFIILSVFPALLMLLSLLRFTGIQVENLVSLMEDFLPHALMETVEELGAALKSNYRELTERDADLPTGTVEQNVLTKLVTDKLRDVTGLGGRLRTRIDDAHVQRNGIHRIDHGAEVRQCAFIRGSALVGNDCVVGNSTES